MIYIIVLRHLSPGPAFKEKKKDEDVNDAIHFAKNFFDYQGGESLYRIAEQLLTNESEGRKSEVVFFLHSFYELIR